ncbi:hypothetical protein GMORB2_1159 [Geosmithia morbida]|uniref:Uncharacterized protein n=1 Tax=Geosmithia morbida TaxID=1094350 RepID=A0A9P5D381_9HYPO|nr:uncharacterized protein GMORB2_1159 [Geosmithia morbida]KAF4125913.1 hypothetical protein GMORB2_1159 [Geosmithia morbida]
MVAASIQHSAPAAVARARASPRILPVVATVASVGLVASYVYSQLSYEKKVMDSRFAQYNNAQSEASRRKTFENSNSDPRTSAFNILGH